MFAVSAGEADATNICSDQLEFLTSLGSGKIDDIQVASPVSAIDLQRPSKRRRRRHARGGLNINASLEKHVSNQANKSDQVGPDIEYRSQLATTYLVSNVNNCRYVYLKCYLESTNNSC